MKKVSLNNKFGEKKLGLIPAGLNVEFDPLGPWLGKYITQLFRQFTTLCKLPIGITSMKMTKICVALW